MDDPVKDITPRGRIYVTCRAQPGRRAQISFETTRYFMENLSESEFQALVDALNANAPWINAYIKRNKPIIREVPR